MIYAQAVKFISKQVYVIAEDTRVLHGTLISVSGTTAKIEVGTRKYHFSHIKHVYPN